MSDRDRFADLSQRLLQNDELIQQDRQFWIDYLLRFLKGKDLINTYSLGDVLEWNFTGDNIIFNVSEMTLQPDYISIDYDWQATGDLPDGSENVYSVATDGTYVYYGHTASNNLDYNVYRYTIASGVFEGIPGTDDATIDSVWDLALDSSNNLYMLTNNGLWKWDGTSVTQMANFSGSSDKMEITGTTAYITDSEDIYHYDLGTETATQVGTANSGDCYQIGIDSSGNVYFAADWDTVDGVAVNGCIKYSGGTGGTWSSMGGGIGGDGYAVCVDDSDNVWAASSDDKLHYWNGSTWIDYASSITTGYINVLAYNSKTGLIVGGAFSSPASGVFRFTNGTASVIGSDSLGSSAVWDIAITSGGTIFISTTYLLGAGNVVQYYGYYDGSQVLGFAPEEQSLKSTDDRMTLDSDVLYPSQSAVRDYAPMKKITTDAPTTDDDVTSGYRVGDIWVDTDG